VSPAADLAEATASAAVAKAPAPTTPPAGPLARSTATGTGEQAPVTQTAGGARAEAVHQTLAAGERPGPALPHVASAAASPAPLAAEAAAPAAPPAAPLAPVAKPVAAPSFAFHAAETVQGMRDLAHVAAARGAARARLQLHPAELGSIDVRLKVTAEGVTAQITAERPEAVQALQQAGAELRRALEDRGLNVVSFEVEHAATGTGSDASAQDREESANTSTSTRSESGGTEPADDAAPETTAAPAGVPAGALVDVLA
jgi:flagellar hook-length control protein FliK